MRVPSAWVCAEGNVTLFNLSSVYATEQLAHVLIPVDIFMPDDLKQKSEAELASRKGTDKFVEYEFVDYKGDTSSSGQRLFWLTYDTTGTTHGFAIRPDLRYPDIIEAQRKSVDQIVNWFERTLVV